MSIRDASAGDAAAIAALINAQNERDGTEDGGTPPDDAVVHVTADGSIDAAGWLETPHGERVVLRVFARDTVGAEPLMRELCEAAPRDRVLRIERVLRSGAQLPAATTSLYEQLGLEFVYIEHEMARDFASLDAAPPVADARIERWISAHDAPLRDAYNDAFSTRGFSGYSEHESQNDRFSTQDDFLADASFVALEQDEIVGFTMSIGARGDGWIDSVGVRPAYRGRGIVDALLLRSMHAMRDAGMQRAVLRVNEDNARAIAVYRRLGFEVRRKHVVWAKKVVAT